MADHPSLDDDGDHAALNKIKHLIGPLEAITVDYMTQGVASDTATFATCARGYWLMSRLTEESRVLSFHPITTSWPIREPRWMDGLHVADGPTGMALISCFKGIT